MVRTLLITLLCLAVGSLAIAGVHAHIPGVPTHEGHSHAHASESHGHSGANLFSVIDADHADSHDHESSIDTDHVTKAFGKLPLLQVWIAGAFLYLVLELLNRVCWQLVRWARQYRPPGRRLRSFLLPPANAPPSTAA